MDEDTSTAVDDEDVVMIASGLRACVDDLMKATEDPTAFNGMEVMM